MEGDDLSEDTVPLPPLPEVQTEVKTPMYYLEQADSLENTSQLPTAVGHATEIPSHNSFEISQPHEYWPFNVLLAKISMKITQYEFRHMKTLHLGKIGTGVVEQCKEPIDFFNVMRKRCYLSPADVLNLQGMLWHINRHDLMQLVAEYAEEAKDVIYVHAASKEPVNGYRHIKFHVSGKDFEHMTVAKLNEIRSAVAGTLLIPKKFVLIDGVEPTNSITVTFQIPELYITVIRDLLKSNSLDISELISLGIDRITIDDEVNILTELDMHEHEITQHQQQKMDMFKELECIKETLSCTETENVKLQRKVADLESESLSLKADLQIREGTCKPLNISSQTSDDGKAEGRQDESKKIDLTVHQFDQALRTFNGFLGEILEACPDKDIILNLLGSHVRIVAMDCYRQLEATIHALQTQISHLTSLTFQLKTNQTVRRRFPEAEAVDDSIEMKTLNIISNKLTTEEEELLQQYFGWTEAEKKEYKEGSESFLTCLIHKEDGKYPLPGGVYLNEFLLTCLIETLHRTDLFVEFWKEVCAYKENERWNKRHTTETIEGKALAAVSHKLTEKDKGQLEKACNFTGDAKGVHEEGSIPLLIRLLRVEDRKRPINGTIEVIKFVKTCLTEKINRIDLFTQFLNEIQQTVPEESGLGENSLGDLELENTKPHASVIREMAGDVKMLLKKMESIEKNTNLQKESLENNVNDYKPAMNISQSGNKIWETLFHGIPKTAFTC